MPTLTVDLSHVIAPGMPVYPGDPAVERQAIAHLATDGYNLAAWRFGCHIGTHLDAPRHFLDAGADVAALALEACCGPARVWRLPCLPDACLEPADLAPWLAAFTPGDRVLLHTGWSARWGHDDYYRRYPVLSPAAAAALAAAGPALVGLDTPSPSRPEADVHLAFLGCGIPLLENLCRLDRLPDRVELLALPLPLRDGDGSPVRAVARWSVT